MRTYAFMIMVVLVSGLMLGACGAPATTATTARPPAVVPTAGTAATPTPDIAAEHNKAILRRYYVEAYTNGNLAAVDDAIAYPDGSKADVTELRTAFPDLKAAVLEQFVDEDRVLVVVTFSGTHKDTFREIPATNKWLTWTAVNVHVMVDGKCIGGSSSVPGDQQLLRELQLSRTTRS